MDELKPNATTDESACDFSHTTFVANLYSYISGLVWNKLDKMTQNANSVTRGEDLPQILPLIMEMELQRKYILAGILKVDIVI